MKDVMSDSGALLYDSAVLKWIGGDEFQLLPYGSELRYEKYYATDPMYQKYGNIYRIKTESKETVLVEESFSKHYEGEDHRPDSIMEEMEGWIINGIKANPSGTGWIFRVGLKYEIKWQGVK